MKKKVMLLWGAFVLCVVLAIVFWNLMNNVNPEYEKVKATVVSSKTEQVVNKKTGSRTNFYKVEVEYNGQRGFVSTTFISFTIFISLIKINVSSSLASSIAVCKSSY